MRPWRAGAVVVIALSVPIAGCSMWNRPVAQCPRIVKYSNAQLDAIQRSINRLPPKDSLRGAMQDYENLRDDSRVCVALEKGR
ncbi:MAG: hypothetical protein ACREFD_07660 [Stellaceae bacterium]